MAVPIQEQLIVMHWEIARVITLISLKFHLKNTDVVKHPYFSNQLYTNDAFYDFPAIFLSTIKSVT